MSAVTGGFGSGVMGNQGVVDVSGSYEMCQFQWVKSRDGWGDGLNLHIDL
jgi:hypothetical protein